MAQELPVWTIISIARETYQDAWWFELETKEGVLILAGETPEGYQVNVSGPGYETRCYCGEMAKERVSEFQKLWERVNSPMMDQMPALRI